MRKLIEALIARLKGGSYRLEDDLRVSDLLGVALERLTQAARGLVHRWRFGRVGGVLFLGRGVTLRHARRIRAGRSLQILDRARVDALSRGGIDFGDNVTVGPGTIIECTGVLRALGESLRVGDRVGIGANSFIGVRGPVTIGSDTIIAPYVSIHAENHVFDGFDAPIRLQGETRKGVSIGNDCWIGAKATILDGVSIGDGAVIAAGAMVTKDVPPRAVAAGVPARVVRERGCAR